MHFLGYIWSNYIEYITDFLTPLYNITFITLSPCKHGLRHLVTIKQIQTFYTHKNHTYIYYVPLVVYIHTIVLTNWHVPTVQTWPSPHLWRLASVYTNANNSVIFLISSFQLILNLQNRRYFRFEVRSEGGSLADFHSEITLTKIMFALKFSVFCDTGRKLIIMGTIYSHV